MEVNLSNIKFVYLLGIGGIGMSSLARYFKSEGCFVAGYDRTETPLTRELHKDGIPIHYSDDIIYIPHEILTSGHQELLVIYTPAIPSDSLELEYFKRNGVNLHKRAEILGLITKDKFCFAVAGTHGKTTTSAILSHILQYCNVKPQAFVGGIMTNYNTNVLLSKGSNTCVVEADEFDRSFLHLSPDVAVITSMDADHLDVYKHHDNLMNAFQDFVNRLNPEGTLVLNEKLVGGVKFSGKTFSYGFSDNADYQIKNIVIEDGTARFDLINPDKKTLNNFHLHLPGNHNILNATAAVICASLKNIPIQEIKEAVASFKGVKRRFEYIYKGNGKIYIDDYAHHPTEIEACLNAASQMHPGRKITAVFQPHLFSRTRDFADGFSQSLSLADEVLLLDIYPARELPIPGVSSEMLLEKISSKNKELVHKENLVNTIHKKIDSIELLMTIGAGDIDKYVPELKKLFEN